MTVDEIIEQAKNFSPKFCLGEVSEYFLYHPLLYFTTVGILFPKECEPFEGHDRMFEYIEEDTPY